MERIGEKERAYIQEVLSGQFSSAGTYRMVTRLEQTFAEKMHVKHAVAMVNGTATLHMALEAAGVGPGDEVVCPPLTMSSTSIAVLHANVKTSERKEDGQTKNCFHYRRCIRAGAYSGKGISGRKVSGLFYLS